MLKFLSRLPAFKLSLLTLLSRVLGLIRDSVYAMTLGATGPIEAFITAYRIPNMLRDLLGEGALSTAVVSRLGQVEVEQGRERVQLLVRRLMAFWMLVFTVLCSIGVLCAPLLVQPLVGGFHDQPEKIELSVKLTRLMFPYLGLVGMSAITMGILHHLRSFGWAGCASIFFNLTIITVIYGHFTFYQPPGELAVQGAALAVLAGGVIQWLVQTPGLKGSGIGLMPLFQFKDDELKKILMMLGPSVLAVAAVQLNVLVNHRYATYLDEGAVSHIYYAFRIMHLPVGLIGVAVASVLLPELAKCFAEQRNQEFSKHLIDALHRVLFFFVPAIIGLYSIGLVLIELLYQRGAFIPEDTLKTWQALMGFLPGILAVGWNKNLTQAFFARNDTRWPLCVSLLSVVLNALLNGYLVFYTNFGLLGLTSGTSIVLFVNAFILAIGLRLRHGILPINKKISVGFLEIALGGFLMGLTLKLIGPYLNPWPSLAQVGIQVGLGASVYGLYWMILWKGLGRSLPIR